MASQETVNEVAQLMRANKVFAICYFCMHPFSTEPEFNDHIESTCEVAGKYRPSLKHIGRSENFQKLATEKSLKLTHEIRSRFKDSFLLEPPVTTDEASTKIRRKAALERKSYSVARKKRQLKPKSKVAESRAESCLHVCPFCKKDFPATKRLLVHGLTCKEIRKLEPRRSCSNCGREMPIIQSYTHESKCVKKLRRSHGRFKCPKCTTSKFTSAIYKTHHHLLIHLAFECLPQVKWYMRTGSVTPPPTNSDSDNAATLLTNIKTETLDDQEEELSNPLPFPDISFKVEAPDEFLCIEDNDHNEFNTETLCVVDPLDIKTEVQEPVETGSESMTMLISCPFCSRTFASLDELTSNHMIRCNGMKAFEPRKSCPHCNLDLPLSLHGIHGMICKQNSCQFILSTNNLKYSDILCPECHNICKTKDMPEQLATCLKHLSKLLTAAMDNTANCDFGQKGAVEDFIGKAGLKGWL